MKKTLSRITVLLLTLALLSTAFCTPVGAVAAMDWDTYWNEYTADGTSLYMAPGSNPSEMNFSWLGTESCDDPAVFVRQLGEADYSVFTGYTVTTAAVAASYKVTVKGLLPDTSYEYYYTSGTYTSAVYTFKTAPEDSFNAVFVSDIHVSYSETEQDNLKNSAKAWNDILTEAYGKSDDISLVFTAGDQGDHGLLSEYEGFVAAPLLKSVPLATSCGNHDYKDTVYPTFVNVPNRFNDDAKSPDRNGGDYWFVKGDVLFLMINSNWTSADDHYTFVSNAVKSNPDVKWRVAVMHHDLYGGHIESRESENKLLRQMYVPIFDEFMVDFVFTGHSHVFSRTNVMYGGDKVTDITGMSKLTDANGTVYITSGSTARPRGDVTTGSEYLAVDHISGEDKIYNVLNFTEDSVTINSYVSGQDEAFDSFTMFKTSNDGGHTTVEHNKSYDIVGTIGLLVSIFQKIGYYFEQLAASIGIEL